VFPDAKQALCAYHVRTAIQQRLQQKLKGRDKAVAFAAIERVVEEIMYLPAKETVEATLQEAEKKLSDFRNEYAFPKFEQNFFVVLHALVCLDAEQFCASLS
jgi:hypothetical protein